MTDLPIGSVWAIVKQLPKVILRRIFPPAKLADLVLVDIRPRHGPVSVNLGDPASFRVWLKVTNLSPFDVELDRASLKLWCGGVVASSTAQDRVPMRSGQSAELLFQGALSDGDVRQMIRNNDVQHAAIEVSAEFNCSLHNFPKRTGHLDGITPEVLNLKARVLDNGLEPTA